MKTMKRIAVICVVISSLFSVQSCSKEGSSSNLKGYWMTDSWSAWDGYQRAFGIHFVNNNTAVYYDTLMNGKYWDNDFGKNSEQFKGKSGWYYQKGCGQTYTYVITEGKIILTSGKIFTILGDELVMEGGSSTFRKCK